MHVTSPKSGKSGSVQALCLLVCACTLNLTAANITGIAISQYSPKNIMKKAANRISWGWNYGKIYRYDVRNGNVSGPVVLHDTYDAHCPRISPSGSRVAFNTSTYTGDPRRPAPDASCKGSIYVINTDGTGEPRKLVGGVNCLIWLDWPVEEYVYYQSDYEGSELWRVNTTGTPNPQKLASNFRGDGKSNPDGARYWSISADGWKVGGWFGGTLQYGEISESGPIVWNSLWGGCGGSISPDGNVLTRNGGSHNTIIYHSPENKILNADLEPYPTMHNNPPSLTFSDCAGNGTNWHRMHWPVNSSEWVLISMGNGYQIDQGCHPVLLKRDGSDCFAVTPLVTDEFYEGSDFWFGDPDGVVGTATHGPHSFHRNALTLTQTRQGLRVNLSGSPLTDLWLLRPDGRSVAHRHPLHGAMTVTLTRPTTPGLYLVRAVTDGRVFRQAVLLR